MDNKSSCSYYTLGYNGSQKVYIGEHQKDKRVCRFCGKSMPDVKFRKKAHALSESIGTKNIINNEECDSCNEFFSSIEQDFYNCHAFLLACYGVKGKKSSRKIKTKDIDTIYENGILTFVHHQGLQSHYYECQGVGKLDFSFPSSGCDFKPQNVYKCLVKYFLSVIDSNFLCDFNEDIKWITSDLECKTLPKVLLYNSNYKKHPQIAFFIRACEHDKFPFAFSSVEFANIGYFFIIPFAHNETINGYMELNLKNVFRQIFNKREFKEVDLTSTKRMVTTQRVEINNIINGKTCFVVEPKDFTEGDSLEDDMEGVSEKISEKASEKTTQKTSEL